MELCGLRGNFYGMVGGQVEPFAFVNSGFSCLRRLGNEAARVLARVLSEVRASAVLCKCACELVRVWESVRARACRATARVLIPHGAERNHAARGCVGERRISRVGGAQRP